MRCRCLCLNLGTGTGSNIRYLADGLPGAQRWLVLDCDAALLREPPERMSSWSAERGYEARTERGRCSCGAASRLSTSRRDRSISASGRLPHFRGSSSRDGVGAARPRVGIMAACACHTLPCGRRGGALRYYLQRPVACTPAEDEDDMVRELMNRHQKRDKGLGGPAAGPARQRARNSAFAGGVPRPS